MIITIRRINETVIEKYTLFFLLFLLFYYQEKNMGKKFPALLCIILAQYFYCPHAVCTYSFNISSEHTDI